MASARRNSNNNDTYNISSKDLEQSKYYDPITHYLDIMPHEYITSSKSHSKNDKETFTTVSKLISPRPATVFKYMLDKLQEKKILSSNDIFNKPIEGTTFDTSISTYERGYILSKCREMPFTSDSETNPPKELQDNLTEFMESRKRIFVGFIKVGLNPDMNDKVRKAIRAIAAVEGHMNSFIIDKKYKQVIRFEPKGVTSYISPWCMIDVKLYLIESLRDARMKTEIERYEFISTSDISGWFSRMWELAIMPQRFDIYCQTYSIYSVLLYCLNMDLLNKEKIFSLFATITQEKAKLFQNYFLKYHLEAFTHLLANGESNIPDKVNRTHTSKPSKPKTKKQSKSNSNSNNNNYNFVNVSNNSKASRKSKKNSKIAARNKSSSSSNNNFNLV
jgi:hypothetical protein